MICVRYERISEFATMAQVVERILGKDEVGGSSPPSSSKIKHLQMQVLYFIQSEGLICNRRKAYEISKTVCHHTDYIKFGLITYRKSFGLHAAAMQPITYRLATDYLKSQP